jgi:hypothetical protein
VTCSRCEAKPVRSLLGFDYCHSCAEAILAPIRDRVFTDEGGVGWGRQAGLMRPDWGPSCADVECTVCQATWVGRVGEPCGWCEASNAKQLRWQAEIVLTPPDADPADQRFEGAMQGWADRLAIAVQAEIITEAEARGVWDRSLGNVA